MPFFTDDSNHSTHSHISFTAPEDPFDAISISTLESSSPNFTSYVTNNSNSTIVFTKPNGESFTIDEILLKKDIANNQEAIYQVLFENIKLRYPEKADEYDVLLKLNRLNYRYTVLSIEFENLKAETAKLTQDFENGFTF